LKILVRILVVAGLFSQGLCFGYLCAGKPSPVAPEVNPALQVIHLEVPDAVDLIEPEKRRAVAETLLSQGDWETAYSHLRILAVEPGADQDQGLRFRLALCMEAATDFHRAGKLYQTILQSSVDDSLLASARVGLARCHLQSGNLQSARQLLWRHCFLGNTIGSQRLRGDALMWLAQTYNVYSDFQPIDLLEDDVLIPLSTHGFDVARQLSLSQAQRQGETENVEKTPKVVNSETPIVIRDVVRIDESSSGLVGSFHAEQANLMDVFQWTSQKLALPIDITEQASQVAEQCSVSFNLMGANRDSALDAMTLPFGLSWLPGEKGVTICSAKELNATENRQLAKSVALRLLDHFQLAFSNHEFMTNCRFQHAVILALDGQAPRALETLQLLRSDAATDSLRQAIDFDLGQMHRMMQNEDPAIQAFSRVADSNQSGMTHAMGLMKLGLMNLEMGQQQQAASSFFRSQQVCDDPIVKEVAVIGLASAYFLDNNVSLAEKTMADSIHQFREPGLRKIATFMQALCAAWMQNENGRINNRAALLETLNQAEWPAHWGTQGKYLKSIGFRLLGFEDVSVELAESALHGTRGAWLRALILRHLTESTRDRELLLRLLVLAEQNNGTHESGFVLVRLAELEFQDGLLPDCDKLCRQILDDPNMALFHSRSLKLLGRVFDKKGQHYQAALCYAGHVPDSITEGSEKP